MASFTFTKPASYPEISPFDKTGTGDPVPTLKLFYFHRAWNLAWLTYETWITEGEADPNPPSGESITGLTVCGFWKKVV